MTKQVFNLGSGANSGNGESLRSAFQKAQTNFDTLFEHANSTSNPHNVTAQQIGAVPTTALAAASGVATLDGAGKLVSSQRPAYTLNEIGQGDLGFTLTSSGAFDLGSPAKPWRDLYVGNVVSAAFTANASTLALSTGISFASTATISAGSATLTFDANAVLTAGGSRLRPWSESTDPLINAITYGSPSGVILEGPTGGSVVIGVRSFSPDDGLSLLDNNAGSILLTVNRNAFQYDGATIWHAGNFDPTSKLDANSASILDVLRTGDGEGSLLDADLLDGQHGSYYSNFAHLTNKPTTLGGYGITDAVSSADYSAADVLAKLLTVDGSGSGLDADLLDGHSTDYFTNATNLTTGTLSDARLPTSMVGKTFTSNTVVGATTGDEGLRVISGTVAGAGGLRLDKGEDYEFAFTLADTDGSAATLDIIYRQRSNYSMIELTPLLKFQGQTVWTQNNHGEGSGLDADLLDGQHGSFYSNASNLTGTLDQDRLPVVNASPGTYGNATHFPIVTVNDRGLVTSVTATPLTNLDAATLDGFDSTYFTNASNLSSGTISDTHLPTALGAKTFTGNITSQALVLLANGAVGAPSVAFSDEPTTGFYRSGTGTLFVAQLGVNRWQFTPQGNFQSGSNTGPRFVSTGASPTVPTILPSRTNLNTGIGGGDGKISLIANSVEIATAAVDGFTLKANTTAQANLAATAGFSHVGLTPTSGTSIDQILTVTDTLTLSTTWQDTSVNAAELASGTYVVQVLVGNEYHSGVMSWYASDTNDTVTDEIALHRAGAAGLLNTVYLRIARTTTGDAADLKLQIAADETDATTTPVTMKFRRMI